MRKKQKKVLFVAFESNNDKIRIKGKRGMEVRIMTNELTPERLKHIVSRLVANANEAHEEAAKDAKNTYNAGRKVAYYEMLDILQAELDANGQDLKEYGLEFDLIKKIL